MLVPGWEQCGHCSVKLIALPLCIPSTVQVKEVSGMAFYSARCVICGAGFGAPRHDAGDIRRCFGVPR